MANLIEIAELCWRQLAPSANDETAISKEEFIATAKVEFAYQLLMKSYAERTSDGYFEVPSYLISEIVREAVNDEIDISDLEISKGLPNDSWLLAVGDSTCDKYMRTTVNLNRLLSDDEGSEGFLPYIVMGRKIKFLKGVHKNKVPIIYANQGENVDGSIDIDDAIAGIIRKSLFEIYGGKIAPTDVTNNSNPGN